MGKLNITFCSFPDFSSNAKPLYEYMKKRYGDQMNFAWAVKSDEMLKKLNDANIEAYKIGTEEYFEYTKTTDVFFSTHCNITGERNDKSIYVELWHGISSKHIGNLSDHMNESDRNWYDDLRKRIDYIVVPSDFWRVIFATRFNINYNRTVSLGYPKLDYFVYSHAKQNLDKVLNLDVSKYSKVIYYMPTFRKGCGREQETDVNKENLFNLKTYDEEKLFKYLRKNNYLLCIKKHPSEELNMNYLENDNVKIIKDSILTEKNITLNEIMNAADLMITDYSSLGIEFVFLNKPVIYLVNDIEDYKKNRGITFNNSDFWMPGYRVCDIDRLLLSIEESFQANNEFENERKEKRNLWFGELQDGGCKEICNFLFDGNQLKKNLVHYTDNEILLEKEVKELTSELNERKREIRDKDATINGLNDTLEKVFNSKGWRFLEKVRKINKVFKK
ncbi:MAG: CDP-glycerol glycerophosphotransferase family protein [Clostridia bacterium]|nr:CDP-glycerol glycerophosphotransferase family protein [Clostridia bacterium]